MCHRDVFASEQFELTAYQSKLCLFKDLLGGSMQCVCHEHEYRMFDYMS